MAHLMLLAFLVDQLQEMKCRLFRKALVKVHNRRSRLWERIKTVYEFMPIDFRDWTEFLEFLADPSDWITHPNSA